MKIDMKFSQEFEKQCLKFIAPICNGDPKELLTDYFKEVKKELDKLGDEYAFADMGLVEDYDGTYGIGMRFATREECLKQYPSENGEFINAQIFGCNIRVAKKPNEDYLPETLRLRVLKSFKEIIKGIVLLLACGFIVVMCSNASRNMILPIILMIAAMAFFIREG